MNHVKHLVRLLLLVFWIVCLGVIYSVASSFGNFAALGWMTLLVYAVLSICIIYIGVLFTIKVLRSK